MTCSDSLLRSPAQREAAHSPISPSVGLALLPRTARLSALQPPFSSGTLPEKEHTTNWVILFFYSLGLGTFEGHLCAIKRLLFHVFLHVHGCSSSSVTLL